MSIIAQMWDEICTTLVPRLEASLETPLTAKLEQLVSILEVVRVEEHLNGERQQRMGRKREDRRPLARAFVAKAVYNLPTTELLIEMLPRQPTLRRICGWACRRDIPSAATFSRAFGEFAEDHLAERVHERLVATPMGEQIVMHLSRDSTEIEAREKPAKKPAPTPHPPRKRGRPKRGEEREPPPLTRLERQRTQTVEEALAELPYVCDVGTKVDSNGHKHSWIGWKTHLDVIDGGLPITVVTTSASLHDSQVAIPMAKRTARRIQVLYELMDAAYDADPIHTTCHALGHRSIIEANPRRGEAVPFDPATALRYQERTTAERVNARLKDEFGGRYLRVRGHLKAHAHIMFGVIALFADQLLKLLASCHRAGRGEDPMTRTGIKRRLPHACDRPLYVGVPDACAPKGYGGCHSIPQPSRTPPTHHF